MKKFQKLSFRLIKKHIARLIASSLIIILSIGLVSGVGSSTSKIKDSTDEYYKNNNVSDLVIKSNNQSGFSEEEIEKIKNHFGENNLSLQSFMEEEESQKRVHFLDINKQNVNTLTLLDGTLPEERLEVLAERGTNCLTSYQVGDKIPIKYGIIELELKVTGIVLNPYYFQKLDEPLLINKDKNVKSIFYMSLINGFTPINDIYIKMNFREINGISNEYKNHIEEEKEWIKQSINNANTLTLEENVSFASIYNIAKKISTIAWFLMIGFLLVAAFVILTIISRLVEEERNTSATLKTLGYNNNKIATLFLRFVIISLIFGVPLSWPFSYGMMRLIYFNFGQNYELMPMSTINNNWYYLISSLLISIVALLTGIISSYISLKEKPADMLKKKPPKKGKTIILEKIPFIWNHLSFKYKCTARNIFRNKKHFFMTVFAVIGSTILVFLASGLLSYSIVDVTKGVALKAICIVILLCAVSLTAIIIYVLTNINISERKRELATFMVLGYYDSEVKLHIFREIYIMVIFGVILGMPLGYLCLNGLFKLLNFGGMNDVHLWVYFITPLIILVFTFLISLILGKKISSIDMNESLKEVE